MDAASLDNRSNPNSLLELPTSLSVMCHTHWHKNKMCSLFSSFQSQCFSPCFHILPPICSSLPVSLSFNKTARAAAQYTLWVSVRVQQRLIFIISFHCVSSAGVQKVTIAEIDFTISHHHQETINNLYPGWKTSLNLTFPEVGICVSVCFVAPLSGGLVPPLRNVLQERLMIVMGQWDKML